MTLSPPTIRLEFGSAFDMLDFVQVVSDYVGRLTGLDEDQLYEVSVAVRESVVNAIKHGNQHDLAKRVVVEFSVAPAARQQRAQPAQNPLGSQHDVSVYAVRRTRVTARTNSSQLAVSCSSWRRPSAVSL